MAGEAGSAARQGQSPGDQGSVGEASCTWGASAGYALSAMHLAGQLGRTGGPPKQEDAIGSSIDPTRHRPVLSEILLSRSHTNRHQQTMVGEGRCEP